MAAVCGLRAPVSRESISSMAAPLTIFVPVTHYVRRYLLEAVESVLAQTSCSWELLLVVDGDRIGHFREVLSEAVRDPRVRLIGRGGGEGLAAAYNTAMRQAQTAFIAPLLGDDLLAPDAVSVMQAAITARPDADFFYGGRRYVDDDGGAISGAYLPPETLTQELFVSGSPVKHLMCWRVETGLACGGVDPTLGNFAADDYDFPWTMFEAGAVFQPVREVLYVYRDHRSGVRLTTHIPRDVQKRALLRILAKHGVSPEVARRRARDALRGYMRQSLYRNEWHQRLVEWIGVRPTRAWREPYRQ